MHCQHFKLNTQKYGKVPPLLPKDISHLNPLNEVHLYMIGYYKVNNFEFQFRVMTCIDGIINLPEVIPVDNVKLRTVVAEAFEDG